MARVTSKRQVTIPKAIADRYGIAAGAEIEFMPAGDAIRVQPPSIAPPALDRDRRLRRLERFDRATERQRARQKAGRRCARGDRGWRREDLYERGSAR